MTRRCCAKRARRELQLASPPVAEGVVIRPERDADHPVIVEVVRAAFVRHPDEVASFVERIRASDQFIPELALVAEDSSGVIAHVMLSWVGVEGGSRTRILNLTPMSVRPDRQRMGVGARLIRDALGRAEEAGEPAVMVEGIAGYYPRFGFERASALGFISPHPKIPDEAFMVKRLPGYSPDLAGRIVNPATFEALGSPANPVAMRGCVLCAGSFMPTRRLCALDRVCAFGAPRATPLLPRNRRYRHRRPRRDARRRAVSRIVCVRVAPQARRIGWTSKHNA